MTGPRAAAGDGDGASRSTRRRPANPAAKPRHSQKQARLWRRRAPLIPLAALPLTAFALALIAIPVAAAS